VKLYTVESLAEAAEVPPPGDEQVRMVGPGFCIIQNPVSPSHWMADLFEPDQEPL